MKKILTQYGAYVLAVALMMPLAQAQPTKIQTAFGDDAGTLSKIFVGLARVMSGKYDWKPGPGVLSVSDVFNLIVEENGLLAVLSREHRSGDADSRRSTRAPGAVDRARAHQRHGSTVV